MSETGAEQTGVPAVDEALTALDGLEERPVDEHPAVFESVHGALRSVLDRRPGRLTGPDRCHPVACVWTRSWSVADSPAPASTPAS